MNETTLAPPSVNMGEHIASTLTHAIMCTVIDPVNARISNAVQQFLDETLLRHQERPKDNTKDWLLGEVIGDFGAVPIVVMAQKYFPDQMQAVSNGFEPLIKTFFQNSAEKSAKNWALRHHISSDTPDYAHKIKEKKEQLYNRSIADFSKTVLWTGVSTVLNIGLQKTWGNNESPILHMLISKAAASVTTGAAVTTARALVPDTTRNFESFVHHKVVKPIEKTIKHILGVKEGEHHKPWTDRYTISETQLAR